MQSEPKRPTASNELPSPTAALVLQEEYVRGYLRTLPPKKRPIFLRQVSEGMRRLEGDLDVVRFGPTSQRAALRAARLEAIAMWRQLLPVLLNELEP